MTDETAGDETADSASPILQAKNSGYSNNNRLKVTVTSDQSLSESGSSATSPKVSACRSEHSI